MLTRGRTLPRPGRWLCRPDQHDDQFPQLGRRQASAIIRRSHTQLEPELTAPGQANNAQLPGFALVTPASAAWQALQTLLPSCQLMTPPRSSREWAVGLISVVVASDRGDARAAAMYSLIVTAKLNDVDPCA